MVVGICFFGTGHFQSLGRFRDSLYILLRSHTEGKQNYHCPTGI